MARQSSRGRGPASGRQAPQAQGMSSSSTPIDRRTALGLVGGAGALVALTDLEAAAYRSIVDLDPRNDREALAVAALTMWPEGYPVELGGLGLAGIGVPVLVVNGSNDLPYARTDDALAAAIPGSQLVEIPDADHLSVVADPRFKDEVLRFFQAM